MISYQQAAKRYDSIYSSPSKSESSYTDGDTPDPDTLASTSSSIPRKFSSTTTRIDHEEALQIWEHPNKHGKSLKDVMTPSLELVRGMVEYVAEHRWEGVDMLIPVVHYWIILSGFEASYVVTGKSIVPHHHLQTSDSMFEGSLASRILQQTNQLPKSSVTAFVESYGGASFVRLASSMGNSWMVAALQISAVGKLLHDGGIPDLEVAEFSGRVWDLIYEKNSPKSEKLGVFWEKCVSEWTALPHSHKHKEL